MEEVKSNPLSYDEFVDAFIDYREEHELFNFDPAVLKEYYIEQWAKEDKTWWEIYSAAERRKSKFNFDNVFVGKNSNKFLSIDSVSTKNINDLSNIDLNTNSLNHTKNWLYGFAENFFAYSYDITYFIFENFLYNDAPHIKNKKYWVTCLKYDHHNMFASLMLDHIYALSVILLPFFNEFLKHFSSSMEFSIFLENHPEYYLIFKNYSTTYYYDYIHWI
jgi:hypothetical protein